MCLFIVSEETRNVSVTVTAENGSSKTYTIAVTRGKDPNKKLSKDNYLTSITSSIGILSPVFNKEKTNYVIYLPYEVDSITFNVTLSDTKYGILTTDIPKTLMPGVSNVFKYTVKAEDENHAWNIIELEDGFYNIDVTSDDSGDTPIYKYFNINDNMILINHFKDEMSKKLKYTNGSKYINTYSTLYEKSK